MKATRHTLDRTLGEYFDEHIEDESEWGEALSPSTFGTCDAVEVARRNLASVPLAAKSR